MVLSQRPQPLSYEYPRKHTETSLLVKKTTTKQQQTLSNSKF
jgi:hypothetical protein